MITWGEMAEKVHEAAKEQAIREADWLIQHSGPNHNAKTCDECLRFLILNIGN